jgi:hypothetical protein
MRAQREITGRIKANDGTAMKLTNNPARGTAPKTDETRGYVVVQITGLTAILSLVDLTSLLKDTRESTALTESLQPISQKYHGLYSNIKVAATQTELMPETGRRNISPRRTICNIIPALKALA